ncbi:MAG: hypothetical protein JETCAE03_33900 [Ignavibacteriaceae bacterium]|nr:MAG: hypothetical protein JETCAE03_33900 [Ignavibacteriaceae bacterium]
MQIYKTTNLINNKIYIGKDTKNQRQYFGSGKLIKKAIKKYGIKNFKKEILEDNINEKKLLCEREKFWIKELNSFVPNGYNLTSGGDGGTTLGFKGKHHSKETKELISKLYKIKFTQEMRNKLSQIAKKRMQNKETRKKISIALAGRKLSKEHINKMLGNKNAAGKDSRKIYKCKNCEIEFKSYRFAKFCNIDCRNKFVHNQNLKEIKCRFCGNIFKTKRNKFCSKSCASKSHKKGL